MGIFDFFKKRSAKNNPNSGQETSQLDNNSFLLETLKYSLTQLGFIVEKHPKYLSLIVNSEIEIATFIIEEHDSNPNILHLMVLTIQSKYLVNGINENIIGIGTTIEQKVNSVVDNYIQSTFLTIINSFSNNHDPELDFYAVIDGKQILWHPILGNLMIQGIWDEKPQNEPFFEILKEKLKDKLTSNKLNWLKLYISKSEDGTTIGECLFNNEHWEEGLNIITEYSKSWELKGAFQGLKQFIMFRRCDSYPEQ